MKLHSIMVFHLKILLFLSLSLYITSIKSTKPPFSCDVSDPLTKTYPFCDNTLDINKRVIDIVSRLTLDEKISQLVHSSPAIPRLGISAFQWWSEGLHGVSKSGRGYFFNGTITAATDFPQVILTSAAFDPHLWFNVSQAIGKEARAFYNEGQALGLTLWAPNINIFRDPRWGRGQETPGEDPLVLSQYAISYVRGIQGDSFEGGFLKDKHLLTSACCKHYTAHDLDSWHGNNRFGFNAKVSKQDMADTFQPPFKSCIQEGQASGLMCAYNQINGIPNCAEKDILNKTVRGEWGFEGYVVSDCDAVRIIHDVQGYAKQPEDAVADVLKAGMDINCGHYLGLYTKTAIEQKKLDESDLDKALNNLFSIRMRLGLFNGDPIKLEYGSISKDQVCTEVHQSLALQMARDGVVLLKNSDNLLPLSEKIISSVAVIGPNGNTTSAFSGNYHGNPCKNVTISQAVEKYVTNVAYLQGCDFVNCTSVEMDKAVELAKNTDQVVVVMGLDQTQEKEEHDRDDLVLPGKQEDLVKSVAAAAKKPIVLILLCGGPVDVSFAKQDPKIGSILWAGYPGEGGGIALAEIMFGYHNPGGRLPMTWYPQEFTKIAMTNMRMRPEPSTGFPGRTYKFYTGNKVFEFGYGLSYTNYTYNFTNTSQDKLVLSSGEAGNSSPSRPVSDLGKELCDSKNIIATVTVKNTGQMAGKHPVLLFARQENKTEGSPEKQLVGFQSVKVGAGESAKIEFIVNPCKHMSKANEEGILVIEQGNYCFSVGDAQFCVSLVL